VWVSMWVQTTVQGRKGQKKMFGAVKNGCKWGSQRYSMPFGNLEETSLPSPTIHNTASYYALS